ncbi:MAG TPA: MASE1 domain-containing protein [Thermoleophilaceae bacterium]
MSVQHSAGAAAVATPDSRRLGLRHSLTALRGGWFARLAGIALLTGVYYGSAKLGYQMKFSGPVGAIVWLPVGVGMSFLYLGGLGLWPGVVAGDLLANDYSTLPLGSAIGQTCGNVLEVVVAVVLLQRLIPDRRPLGRTASVVRMLIAIAAGTAVSATIGLASTRLGGVISTGDIPRLWRTWWLGDTSGALIVVPLALAWSRSAWRAELRQRAPEAVVVVAAVIGLSELAFRSSRPLTYLTFPAFVWAAFRLGWAGTTLVVAIAGGFAAWATAHYEGPFAFGSLTGNILATQAYIVVAALSSLFLAAAVWERERFAERLRASRVRLADATDNERKRIERDLHDGAQQRLTALAVYLELAAEQSEQAPEGAPEHFRHARQDLLTAIDELRELAHGIHPPALKQHGLAAAIRSLAGRSQLPLTVVALPHSRGDGSAEAAAYFVVAEALTNAQKHSRASSVWVSVRLMGHKLLVEVADDGVGGAHEAGGVGLQGLRDRVEALGGDFAIASRTGIGTHLRATIPARPAKT